jgi:murein L,D-transpeptidase YcbB/YkuD
MPPASPVASSAAAAAPATAELRRILSQSSTDAGLAEAYGARGYRPIWSQAGVMRPEADALVRAIADAKDEGLDPQAYRPAALAQLVRAARGGSPEAQARADLALSRALAAYVEDLHTPPADADMLFTDPAVARPSYAPRPVLAYLAGAADLGQAVAELTAMSPPYVQLRDALRTARAAAAAPERQRLILANMARARALPARLGRRYVLVDAAAQMLWLYEDGAVSDSMPVVVGKPSEPTPMMAGLIRYAVLRPYWNIPPDLVRTSVAPAVLRRGLGYLAERQMEALSDWSETAQVLDPSTIDWAAVAGGRQTLRMRQRPGAQNMMGQIKFMFPNQLGVYLHDTPLKGLFHDGRRAESAGCVRLADAPRLAARLAPEAAVRLDASGLPEERVDLPSAVPVYLVYFTVAPSPGQPPREDIYHRDPPLLRSAAAAARQTPAA